MGDSGNSEIPSSSPKLPLELQQRILSAQLCDRIWDEFDININEHQNCLFYKIAFPLFQNDFNNSDNNVFDFKLDKKKTALVNEIMDKCTQFRWSKASEKSHLVHMAVIFVGVYKDKDKCGQVVPLFRVRSLESDKEEDIPNNTYVDHDARVYSSWENYKSDNTWNSCHLVVPKDGYYKNDFEVEIINQRNRGKINKIMDKVSLCVGIGTTLGMLGGLALSLNPATAPLGVTILAESCVTSISTGIYDSIAAGKKLIDRKKHSKALSLSDGEARQLWLAVASGLTSFAAGASSKFISKTGGVLLSSRAARATFNGLIFGSAALTGGSIANDIYTLHKRGGVTAKDVGPLCLQILLFSHQLLTVQTANRILARIQNGKLSNQKHNLSDKGTKVNNTHMEDHGKWISKVNTAFKFVKTLETIDSVRSFFKKFNTDQQKMVHEFTTDSSPLDITDRNDKSFPSSNELKCQKILIDEFLSGTFSFKNNSHFKEDCHEPRLRPNKSTSEAHLGTRTKENSKAFFDLLRKNKILGLLKNKFNKTSSKSNSSNENENTINTNEVLDLPNHCETDYLTPEQYFLIAKKIAGQIERIFWFREEELLQCSLASSLNGPLTLTFKNSFDTIERSVLIDICNDELDERHSVTLIC